MKTMKFLSLAALALTFAACSSNDDNDFAQQPTEQVANGEITITATIAPKDGALTRATLGDDGTNITFAWQTTDEFAILFNDGSSDVKRTATVKSISGSTATITFTIPSTLGETTDCKIVYPASAANDANTGIKTYAELMATQDGALSDKLDVRYGTGTITKSTGSLTVNADWKQQFAIFKFTLGSAIDATHSLVIKDGSDNTVVTVTPTASMTTTYVAMPATNSSATYKFEATTSDNKIVKSGNAIITPGKYYQTTLAARYPLAMASADKTVDIGSVIGYDGKIYLNPTAATNASTTAVAMIAYVGTESDCTHGLAIALENVGTYQFNQTESAVTTFASTRGVTGGTWRVPTIKDWQYMLIGCGLNASYAQITPTWYFGSYSGLVNKLSTAQGTALTGQEFWASDSYSGNKGWFVWFCNDGANAGNAIFEVTEYLSSNKHVRAVLVF